MSICKPNFLCGNFILETGEECDNGNNTGCIDCTIDDGYTCAADGDLSICTLIPICGNFIKEDGEECDNGNLPGCIDCTIDLGYTCVEDEKE